MTSEETKQDYIEWEMCPFSDDMNNEARICASIAKSLEYLAEIAYQLALANEAKGIKTDGN